MKVLRRYAAIIYIFTTTGALGFLHRRAVRNSCNPLTETRSEVTVEAKSLLEDSVFRQIDRLVHERSELRWRGEYDSADSVRAKIEAVVLPDCFSVSLIDISRNKGGGSTWSLNYTFRTKSDSDKNILHVAHAAMGMAAALAKRGMPMPRDQLDDIGLSAREQMEAWDVVEKEVKHSKDDTSVLFQKLTGVSMQLRENLTSWHAVRSHLAGRKAADAAFWFAIAGVTDSRLFSLLTKLSANELKRFGTRPSCRVKDLFAVVERLAAAGVCDHEYFENAVQLVLNEKLEDSSKPPKRLLNLHSDHSALMIWKFSTRQRKQKAFLESAAKHWESEVAKPFEIGPEPENCMSRGTQNNITCWDDVFENATRPLVIDIGCGMGVSILGLASPTPRGADRMDKNTSPEIDWAACNFLGVDLSHLSINYAKGIAARWGIDSKAAFFATSADTLLDQIRTYPGSVTRILIQFPTPYRLPKSTAVLDNNTHLPSFDERGNSQLPKSAFDGFMVTSSLFRRIFDVIDKSHGNLYMQSNCEDVAVWMRQLACSECLFETGSTSTVVDISGEPTKRTLDWLAMGGCRAIGLGWTSAPILPRRGRSETEIACILNKTPVHRCILKPRSRNDA